MGEGGAHVGGVVFYELESRGGGRGGSGGGGGGDGGETGEAVEGDGRMGIRDAVDVGVDGGMVVGTTGEEEDGDIGGFVGVVVF